MNMDERTMNWITIQGQSLENNAPPKKFQAFCELAKGGTARFSLSP